jgi:hypothetical protein
MLVNDENGNAATPVEPLPHGFEQPAAPLRLAHDDEVPAAGARLAKKRGARAAVRNQLRYRDVLRHHPSGILDVPLRPLHQVLREPLPAHWEHDRAGRCQGRSPGGAAQEPEPSVTRLHQFHGPRERFSGGLAVVDSDEDAVEQHPSWSLAC